jgi:deoxyadenosine/deoxycytidine kinase
MKHSHPVIAVVGPCAAGKSTLISGLSFHGYKARHVAQEHSFVPDMWEKIVDPDILIYLDVSYQVSNQRTGTKLKFSIFQKQRERLRHAKKHADVIINTDYLQPEQVLKKVLDLL